MTFSYSFHKSKSILFLAVVMALMACSSEPKVTELAVTSDPQVELDRVDGRLKQAEANQVDILSPKNFEAAKTSWHEAVKLRSANEDQRDVLHSISVSQAYLEKANSVAGIANQVLGGAISARRDALAAQAQKNYPKEMKKSDGDLRKVTLQIERNDTSEGEKQNAALEKRYREIEIDSIKKEKLEPAEMTIKKAIGEGAKKLTPNILEWANKQYSQAESAIVGDRHNTALIEKASADAKAAADRLLKMVRNAKGSSAKNPEELATQVEAGELAAVQSESELKKVGTELTGARQQLASTSEENKKLESQARLEKEYELARAQFSKEEAEVYKQGDKLLLRLKGLSFVKNKSEISSGNFALLGKVQGVIKSVGPDQVAIEGHTDSVGGKAANEELSKKRAEAVQAYLIANRNIEAEKVTATGFGFSKPIATNKTAEGRAQNRRVDVIIQVAPVAR